MIKSCAENSAIRRLHSASFDSLFFEAGGHVAPGSNIPISNTNSFWSDDVKARHLPEVNSEAHQYGCHPFQIAWLSHPAGMVG